MKGAGLGSPNSGPRLGRVKKVTEPKTQLVPLNWPKPPLTQNQVRRQHYYAEAAAKKQAITEARWAIRAAKVTPMAEANVRLHYRPGTKRLCDADGLGPTLKVALDALVAEEIVLDDNYLYVPEASIRIHKPLTGLPGALWLELIEPQPNPDNEEN